VTSRSESLRDANRRALWNPFTQMKQYLADEPVVIERGEGVMLYDVDGRAYYDGNSSLWLNVHGHNRRELNDALIAQLGQVAHSTLLGMANIPAIELAERLVAIAPGALSKVYFSDSGATAVEIALKIAFGYWRRKDQPAERRFVAFENGYHGDTIGAMSVGGIERFHDEYASLFFPVDRVPYPYAYRFPGTEAECAHACLAALESVLQAGADEIAAIVIEPLVQAAGGMIMMPEGFLPKVAALARQYDVLLIADEVATGFGRTGAMFACDHEGVAPDLMTIGKGLTGGYLPVAATLATDAIYDAFFGEVADLVALFHGHSFTGNQLGCAVGLASLDLFAQDNLVARVEESARLVAARLKSIADLPHVGDVRQRGLMIGIELVADRTTKTPYVWTELMGAKVCRRARELGMLTRPLGDIVVFMPPLVSSDDDLVAMIAILTRAIAETTESAPGLPVRQ
jgi:adenosylmethionine-8-amino-7-oxononanoate transaminase